MQQHVVQTYFTGSLNMKIVFLVLNWHNVPVVPFQNRSRWTPRNEDVFFLVIYDATPPEFYSGFTSGLCIVIRSIKDLIQMCEIHRTSLQLFFKLHFLIIWTPCNSTTSTIEPWTPHGRNVHSFTVVLFCCLIFTWFIFMKIIKQAFLKTLECLTLILQQNHTDFTMTQGTNMADASI